MLPNLYFRYQLDKRKCLFLYLNPSPEPPRNFAADHREKCKGIVSKFIPKKLFDEKNFETYIDSKWPNHIIFLFGLYRVLVNIWMLVGKYDLEGLNDLEFHDRSTK